MASGSLAEQDEGLIQGIGRITLRIVGALGDLFLFAWSMFRSLTRGLPRRDVLVPIFYQIGVQSIPVVIITGTFIGMVLAVQSYDQFRAMHFESRLGAVINGSLVKELGPVLAATMLAGRVGSSIAAELGTMKVTEQIEALKALGADPVRYLVLPRFLACFLLIPLLTGVADCFGILGGWAYCVYVLNISEHLYWSYSSQIVMAYDVLVGLAKSVFFGGAIALIACHRGFNSGSGAEGVGRAATESFVLCFVVILVLDFLLGVLGNSIYYLLVRNNLPVF